MLADHVDHSSKRFITFSDVILLFGSVNRCYEKWRHGSGKYGVDFLCIFNGKHNLERYSAWWSKFSEILRTQTYHL